MGEASSGLWRLVSALGVLLAGCAHSVPPANVEGQNAPAPAAVASQARSVIDAVVALRGLAETSPIATRIVDDGTFGQMFAAKSRKEARPKDLARGIAVAPDNFLGFYDEFQKTIILRDHLPKWATDSGTEPQDLLAHEVVHALQDQHFGIPKSATIDDDDRLLAVSALYEGDAQLVMKAYAAQRKHKSWRHAALFAFQDLNVAPEVLIRGGVFSPTMMKLPPGQRAAMIFPYLDGLAFASTLFRAGGFALIDRAFSHPPESTADILEPARYLSGEHPAVFGPLPVGAGAAPTREGPVGERGLRVLLGTLFPSLQSHAGAAVVGWNGDRLGSFTTPGAAAGLWLATEWKSAEDAQRFVRFVTAGIQKYGEEHPGSGGMFGVAADGTSVGIACYPGAAQVAPRLLHLASPARPSDPPFGPVTIPPAPAALTERPALRGTIEGGHYESRWLAVQAAIPPGFAADTLKPELQLRLIRKDPSVVVAIFSLIAEELSSAGRTQAQRMIIEALVGATPKSARPVEVSSGERKTPLGTGTETTWRVAIAGKKMFARSLIVDACAGQAAYLWVAIWADDDGARAVDAWTESFQPTAGTSPPACEDLQRENAPE